MLCEVVVQGGKLLVKSQDTGLLKINLSAIRHNWRTLRGVFSGEHCGAVVKANAYGLGYAPVVQALFSEGCRSFFVASFGEAMALKKLLATRADIYVLQGCPEGMEMQFVSAQIIPVIVSETMLRRWCKAVQDIAAPCVIKVNTGMNRLGLSIGECERWLQEDAPWNAAQPQVIMSHMACADTLGHPLNLLQLERFKRLVGLAKKRFPGIKASLANSASLFLGEAWHFDLARPGIALYGGREGIPSVCNLRPVVTLSLPVIQVREISSGEWVGYGGEFRAEHKRRIAVVCGGYADGLIRAFSSRAVGKFKGHSLAVLGRVSMDSCVFDISSLEEGQCPVEGDYIEVFGPNCDITEQSARAGTISYELLTRLGERLRKHYIEK